MKKILIVFGTRPEAIKFAPIIKEIKNNSSLKGVVCVFRQHDKMLDNVLKIFNIAPDYDLKITLSDKALFNKKINIFKKAKNLIISGFSFLKFLKILKKEKPDILMVQGDTSTAFLAAFLAYHFKIKIAHIEAGLRTYDKYSPFPEEMNRQLISRLADFHFAPTEQAKNNLLKEGIANEKIFLTGNTAIDALFMIKEKQRKNIAEYNDKFLKKYSVDFKDKRIILVTAHRRESFGEGLKNIFSAIKEIAQKRSDVEIIYPVHLNPNVYHLAQEILNGVSNIYLIEPLEYDEFVFLMNKSYLILTDSGGIQEEAPSLKKPVLVMRNKTERQEGIEMGVSKLVGTNTESIINETFLLLDDENVYKKMASGNNPYGDGAAAKKIIEAIIY
ncbi:UDP-N-acetylglucosamine 2-epimerase (non-hydrolyzing) [Candidatus Wolfebacteria bacterium]|nr:UDP-N-acetylglucosamine 2-epimerase (non-hydrolyzing) [Candidatus Wolfebacteria bacterium]